jgi:hypothetical protein
MVCAGEEERAAMGCGAFDAGREFCMEERLVSLF